MNAVIAEESVLRGWVEGVRAGLGAMAADVVFFVLALLGVVTFVERFPLVRAGMVGVGGVLMLYFAYGAARETQGSFRPETGDVAVAAAATDPATAGDGSTTGASDPPDAEGRLSTGFRKAFVLALTNPYQVLFWLTVGVGLLEPGTVDVLARSPYVGQSLSGLLVVRTGSPLLLTGFFGGIVLWITAFPAALVSAERRVERLAPVVAGASALVLACFGLLFLADALGTFA
jgi:threonine/homoserine/homoserine lactone efflux protein